MDTESRKSPPSSATATSTTTTTAATTAKKEQDNDEGVALKTDPSPTPKSERDIGTIPFRDLSWDEQIMVQIPPSEHNKWSFMENLPSTAKGPQPEFWLKRKDDCAKLTEREMKKLFLARGTKSGGYDDDDDDEDEDEDEGGDDDSFDSYHQYPISNTTVVEKTWSDSIPPTENQIVAFVQNLPTCILLTVGFDVDGEEASEEKNCRCPLSRCMGAWRKYCGLDHLGENYCRKAGNNKYEPKGLLDHLDSMSDDPLHLAIKVYLTLLYSDYNGSKLQHKAFYGVNTTNYKKAAAHEVRRIKT